MKSISIFGSTGSVGKQAVQLISQQPDEYQVEVLTANNNVELLAQQAQKLRTKIAIITNSNLYKPLKERLGSTNIKVFAGQDALLEYAALPIDIMILSIVGTAALLPLMQALQNARIIGLANKESLVCAGHLLRKMEYQAQIIPLDSEHNAIYQIYNDQVQNITLTASGGPLYRNNKHKDIASITNHPIWPMGKKISVDSATMINKVLEVIEAHYLFNIPMNDINILVHPEAIVHGMVTYSDGNNIAVLNKPSMEIPLSYMLNWPNRGSGRNNIDLTQLQALSFFKPDPKQFPALKFLQTKNYIALNAANEVAVNSFLNENISFDQIVEVIEKVLSITSYHDTQSIEEVIDYDKKIKKMTYSICYDIKL